MSDDYWYDDALFLCEDILKEFSDDAWNELLKTIPNYSAIDYMTPQQKEDMELKKIVNHSTFFVQSVDISLIAELVTFIQKRQKYYTVSQLCSSLKFPRSTYYNLPFSE